MKPGLLFILLLLTGCAAKIPSNVNHICSIFRENPNWYHHTRYVAHRWHVPIAVQMAVIHQESKFDSRATPPRTKLLWIIPWQRPSTAYGYSQALNQTWAVYKKHQGRTFASRDSFADAVDFIGWYANQAHIRANIPPNDPYRLYLAYHEGVGGYMKKTYLKKPWLIHVAHKVSARASIYQAQLKKCQL